MLEDSNIIDFKDKYDVFIFDAYGTFYDGSELYESAKETMEQLLLEGKKVYILSNSPRLAKNVEDNYSKKGLEKNTHYLEISTPGEDLRQDAIRGEVDIGIDKEVINVYVSGHSNYMYLAEKTFEGTKYNIVKSMEEADCVYINAPQLTEDEYEKFKNTNYKNDLYNANTSDINRERNSYDSTNIEVFREEIEKIARSNLPVINANPDHTTPRILKNGKTIYTIRQGSIVEEIRKSRKRDMGQDGVDMDDKSLNIMEYGKPHPSSFKAIFNYIENDLGKLNKSRVCMIGDTIGTDIKGANNVGIDCFLCTKTGITANKIKEIIEKTEEDYNMILKNLIDESGAAITYTIDRVGKNNESNSMIQSLREINNTTFSHSNTGLSKKIEKQIIKKLHQ